jgi:CHAT domain-containing protein/tetratricopeptide (TPR) repeat protein
MGILGSVSVKLKTNFYKLVLFLFIGLFSSISAFAFTPNKKIKKDTILGNSLQNKAKSLLNENSYKLAAKNYLLAAQLFEKHDIWDRTVHNYGRLGFIEIILENYDSAYIYLSQAKKIVDFHLNENTFSNKMEISEIGDFLGHYYYAKRDYSQAIEHYSESLNLINEIITIDSTKIYKKVNSLNNIGSSYFYLRNYTLAIDYGFKALQLQIDIAGASDYSTAIYYYNIASLYNQNKDYIKSIEYYKKAIEVFESFPDKKDRFYAFSYNNLASLYYDTEFYDESFINITKAYNLYIDLFGSNSKEAASILNRIGRVQIALNELDSALVNINKSKEIRKDILGDNNLDYARSLESLGLYYDTIHNYSQSIDMYKKAIDIQEKIYGDKNIEIAKNYNKIGIIHLQNKNYKLALDFFQKAINSSVKGFNNKLVETNPKVFDNGYDLSNLNDSIWILSKPLLFEILNNKAKVLDLDYQNTKNVKQLKSSFSTYKLAIQLLEIIRKEITAEGSKYLLSDDAKRVYTEYLQVAYELFKLYPEENYAESIFNICEISKSAVLRDQLKENYALNNSNIPGYVIEQERDLTLNIVHYRTELQKYHYSNDKKSLESAELKALKDKYFKLNFEYDTLKNYIKSNYQWYNRLISSNIYSINEIKEQIDSTELILNYFIGENKVYIVSIDKNNLSVTVSDIDNSFEKTVGNYYKSIKKYKKREFLNYGSELYSILIKPIEEIIRDKHKLLIIPNDYLYYIPFETLFSNTIKSESNLNYSDLNYLIKDFEISYYHSTSMWFENKKAKQDDINNRGFIGFAPVFTKNDKNTQEKFDYLPFSESEITGINNLFIQKGLQSEIYINSEATEKTFKENIFGYKYIHVATHGFSNDKNPELSGLAFYNNSNNDQNQNNTLNDGILYSKEMYNLTMNPELVVLSSCESGTGQLIAGEGLIAITRGFLNSGAPNILFSLWKVPDEKTSVFMKEYYEYILNGSTYTDALRKTKLNLIQSPKTNMPRFWSGFVLIGL